MRGPNSASDSVTGSHNACVSSSRAGSSPRRSRRLGLRPGSRDGSRCSCRGVGQSRCRPGSKRSCAGVVCFRSRSVTAGMRMSLSSFKPWKDDFPAFGRDDLWEAPRRSKPSHPPFFPAGPASPGSSRPLRCKKLVCSGAPLRFAPAGFIGVTLPITVSPSQGIGPCGT
jgi:hypothetical protein